MENKIKEIRKAKGLTLQELADIIGTSAPQIDRLEKGLRKLSPDWIKKISSALKVHPSEIIPELGTPQEVSTIYKVGYVQAGKWNEACQLPEDEWEEIPYPINDNIKYKNIFALGVRGDSMDKILPPEHTTLICCPIEEYCKKNDITEIENGKYVIVYRISPDGLCEATVKKYMKTDDETIILVAESSNPLMTNIILHPDDNEYKIAAIVIGDMRIY